MISSTSSWETTSNSPRSWTGFTSGASSTPALRFFINAMESFLRCYIFVQIRQEPRRFLKNRRSSCVFTLPYGRVHHFTVMPFSAKYLTAPGWKGMAMPSVAKVRSISAPLAWAAVISSLFSKMVFTMA